MGQLKISKADLSSTPASVCVRFMPCGYKIIIVILCLLLTSFVMQRLETADTIQQKTRSLAETMTSMGPWHNGGDIHLDQKVVDELKLDDFIFRNFTNGTEVLSLYIGYYNSTKKVGAAHDPMVCYPGQGWVLSDISQNVLSMKLAGEDIELPCSTMIAERDGERELLVYWFQAYDQATSGTLAQKIALLRNKIMAGGEDNAFVRIGVALHGKKEEEARQIIFSFVENFYPVFTNYILVSGTQGE